MYAPKSTIKQQLTQNQGQGGGGQANTSDLEISIETFEDDNIKMDTPTTVTNKKENLQLKNPETPPEVYAPLEQMTNRSEVVENMFTSSIVESENLDAPVSETSKKRRSLDRAA